VLDDEAAGSHAYGGASRWWLHHSLESLERSLHRHNSSLILRRGEAVEELCRIAEETGAKTVHAIRHYEPWWRKAQGQMKDRIELVLHDGNYLHPPGSIVAGSGDPYKIFTPFKKALLAADPPHDPLPEPKLTLPDRWPESDRLADWNLLPVSPDWAGGIREAWEAGEAAAHDRLEQFSHVVANYADDRNLPSIDGSSRLSPHLHFGEVSARQVWHALAAHRGKGADTFRSELIWRDYVQNVICQFPRYTLEPYRGGFGPSLWRDPETDNGAAYDLAAWQQGRTGYPIVDAGMRQLWAAGWMHNRVRMIAASFLVKHLLIDWRHGERWFWDTLVDADYANNGVNWQWVSGTGVDSNMFVRIMAPLGQSEKFDAGDYIRRWVPELADISDPYVHDPEAHGCRPADYPEKLIGHREARQRALDAYRAANP